MYKIGNEQLEIHFDQKGSIIELRDNQLNRDYLTNNHFANLFRLLLPTDDWDGRYADSRDQREVSVTEITEETIRFRYPDILAEGQSTGISVESTVSVQGDGACFSLKVLNHSKTFVNRVLYPVISGFERSSDDLVYITPTQLEAGVTTGVSTRFQKPFDSLGNGNHKGWSSDNNRRSLRYPHFLVSSWVDYSDNEGGVSLETRNPGFDLVDFCLEREIAKASDYPENNVDVLTFSLQQHINIPEGEEWSNQNVIVRCHQGDWHIPALAHRKWLEAVSQKPDIPREFRESLGWCFYFMKHQDGTVANTYDDLPKMAQAALAAGIKNILLFGWTKYGHDNYYPFGYFPNEAWGGEDKLKGKIAECKQMGCRIIPFFNGTLLDISTKEYGEKGDGWCVKGRSGSVYLGYDFSRAVTDYGFATASLPLTTERNMTLHDICITSQEAKAWWKNEIQRIVGRYQFGNLQLDQIGHKCYACYDANHGHKQPQDAYTKDLLEFLSEIREQVLAINPDGVIIGEGFNDLIAQYCDGFWDWNQSEYAELLRYSVPWADYSCEIDALEFDKTNYCFAYRILLDLKVEGGMGILSDYPEYSCHLKKLSQLKQKLYSSYVTGYFNDTDSIGWQAESAIKVTVFDNCSVNRHAVIIANLENQAGKAQIDLPDGIKIFYLNGEEKVGPSRSLAFDLGSYEVIAVEFSK